MNNLDNKPILEGQIYRWLLLYHKFSFEVVIKPMKHNVGPNHLSRIESGESCGATNNQLHNVDLFRLEAILDYLEEIAWFLTSCFSPK